MKILFIGLGIKARFRCSTCWVPQNCSLAVDLIDIQAVLFDMLNTISATATVVDSTGRRFFHDVESLNTTAQIIIQMNFNRLLVN